MKLNMAALAMACITAVTAASLAGCNQNQGDTGTDESWNKVSEAGKLVLGLDDAFPPMGLSGIRKAAKL